ncbi:flavin reductase family protein [Parvibaculum sp.]|uniref:flavin reductase family protein n=1 Tax=Parvibaculum sp. TaxID=2024848 RepID=UPI00272F7F1C|nr:flavin reductase family protein [Parvibaculum sp.]MDP1627603.1 flavin reductase family protein [Parvibaculum sp.]MDP2148782.1 flavin reductase family protein [Parvibaculum sp.]MDP3328694.1 flavin reductase family protein [Parvibaculum sp.]
MSQTSRYVPSVVDQAEYRNALGSFATGVTVVTTKAAGAPVGTTVSAFSALSLTPPLVLVALALKSETLAHIKRAGFFSVNILSAGQDDIATCFSKANGSAKFEGISHRDGQNGAPLIDGVAAAIECDLEDSLAGGDHEILVGLVRAASVDPNPVPLVYYRSAFAELTVGGLEVR